MCPACLVAWGAYEVGGAAYDIYNAAKTVLDAKSSAAEKRTVVGLAALSVFAPGGGYTAASSAVARVLGEGAELIGRTGSNAATREVVGGATEARALFNQLTKGATVVPHPKHDGGLLAKLSGGGVVGYRPTSTSLPGKPTIDINVAGVSITKIHYVDK